MNSIRYPFIDGLRGVAIVLMMAYHFTFDLNYFNVVHIDFNHNHFWLSARALIVSMFLGLVGVSAALVLTGATINIMSLMAIVMLVGIVVNNAILILDLAAQLRREGKDAKTAILEASPRRFRAITMTTLAIVAGIMPQALGGVGANYTVAMAVVTMGGVVAAGTLSLFIIPVVYTWFDRFSRKEKAPA